MYRKRTLQEGGSWIWKDVNPDIPEEYEAVNGLDSVYRVTAADGSVSYFRYVRNEDDTFAFVPVDENGKELDSQADASAIPDNSTATKSPQNNQVQIPGNSNAVGTVTQSGDGTYIQTETLITAETSGGWVTTYQTVITRTYNERGILLSTKKSEPVIISKVKSGGVDVNAPDPSKIAATLNEEYARVSVGLSFNTKLANEVLAELNAERTAEGLPALSMDTSSEAYKLAQIRAADMAIYDHSDFDSPNYGTLAEMMARYNIQSAMPSENVWKATTSKNAGAIHARFMVLEASRQALMSEVYTNIGIAIVQRNGYYYICGDRFKFCVNSKSLI